jgi:hypothetical protein
LDPELDKQIFESGDHFVLAAWCSRPGRKASELETLIRKDKRITVRSAVAELSGLPLPVYELLAKKPSAKVCVALLMNPSVPPELAVDVARGYSPLMAENGGWSRKNSFSDLLTLRPEIHESLVATVPPMWVTAAVLEFGYVSPTAVERLVRESVWPAIKEMDFSRYYWSNSPLIALNNAARLPGFPTDLEADISALLASKSSGRGYGANHHQEFINSRKNQRLVKLSTALEARSVTGDEVDQILLTIKTTPDATAALGLWSNPAMPSNRLHELLPYLGPFARAAISSRWADPTAVGLLGGTHPSLLDDSKFAKTTDPGLALSVAMATFLTESPGRVPSDSWLRSRFMTPTLALRLPAVALCGEYTPPGIVASVREATMAAFGDRDEAWAMFADLMTNFVGSLRELIDTVTDLTNLPRLDEPAEPSEPIKVVEVKSYMKVGRSQVQANENQLMLM